jgi:hypothetical protein
MDVIALRGQKNNGKSETINIVYQYLLLFGYRQVPGHFRILGNAANRDFFDVLEKKNDLIGIFSMGDYSTGPDSVANLLYALFQVGCKKAVCACTIQVGTEKAVRAYSHIFINKKVAGVNSIERIVNGEDAEDIYKLI